MTLHRQHNSELSVTAQHARIRLGRIHKVAMTGERERWHWNLFALLGPSDRIAHDGYTDTLKQAKAEFAASVRAISKGLSTVKPCM